MAGKLKRQTRREHRNGKWVTVTRTQRADGSWPKEWGLVTNAGGGPSNVKLSKATKKDVKNKEGKTAAQIMAEKKKREAAPTPTPDPDATPTPTPSDSDLTPLQRLAKKRREEMEKKKQVDPGKAAGAVQKKRPKKKY